MAWYIRYSSANSQGFVTREPTVYPHTPALSERAGLDQQFLSREAAVAWVLRYVDARIVTKASELSTFEPTCVIEEAG